MYTRKHLKIKDLTPNPPTIAFPMAKPTPFHSIPLQPATGLSIGFPMPVSARKPGRRHFIGSTTPGPVRGRGCAHAVFNRPV